MRWHWRSQPSPYGWQQSPLTANGLLATTAVGILAALVNAAGLVAMAGAIFWEALQRLYAPEPVQSGPMIWVALLAIILNSGIAWWLSRAAKEDLNIRGAYLHMIGDAAASFGVVIAGIIIALTGAYIADPIVSIVFAALVLWSSWGILTESIHVLLEATPAGLDLAKVEQAIRGVAGVLDTHDIHVWTVSLRLDWGQLPHRGGRSARKQQSTNSSECGTHAGR